jgi:hypothetical protein
MFLLITSIACFCFSLLLLVLVWCLLWLFICSHGSLDFVVWFGCSFYFLVCFHFSFLLFVCVTCFVHLNKIQFVVEPIITKSPR